MPGSLIERKKRERERPFNGQNSMLLFFFEIMYSFAEIWLGVG